MRRGIAAAAGLLVAAMPAHAHTVIDGVSGFPGGLLHPLLVPAHALLLLTLGLLVGQQSAVLRRRLVPLFPVSQLAAIGLIAAAAAADSQALILWLCAINGALLALAWPLPAAVPAMLTMAAALALMLDSVPALLSVRDTLLALSGTAVAALLLFVLFVMLSAFASRPWQIVGRRIIGSWAAASAVLVLALRFVK